MVHLQQHMYGQLFPKLLHRSLIELAQAEEMCKALIGLLKPRCLCIIYL